MSLLVVAVTVAGLTTLAAMASPDGSELRASAAHRIGVAVFALYVVWFSAVSNNDVLDRRFYTEDLERASYVSFSDTLNSNIFQTRAGDDLLYVAFIGVLSRFGTTTEAFFSGVAIACLFVYIWSLSKILNSWQVAFVMLTTIALGIFTSYTSIVARQGISMSLIFASLIVASALERRKLGLLLAIIGCLFHWSALPFAAVALISVRPWIKPRLVLTAWAGMAILFVTNTQEAALGPLVRYIPKYGDYTSSELAEVYTGGTNRTDFLLASLGLGVIFLIFQKMLEVPRWYGSLLKSYWAMNSLFLLMGYVYYSDRLAAFSWFLAPILLAAPAYATNSRRSRNFGALVLLGSVFIAFAAGPLSGTLP
ncbi:EpsG family protein [Janibacter indicus]|nr:EpsG family protein [Janibacter indicus]